MRANKFNEIHDFLAASYSDENLFWPLPMVTIWLVLTENTGHYCSKKNKRTIKSNSDTFHFSRSSLSTVPLEVALYRATVPSRHATVLTAFFQFIVPWRVWRSFASPQNLAWRWRTVASSQTGPVYACAAEHMVGPRGRRNEELKTAHGHGRGLANPVVVG